MRARRLFVLPLSHVEGNRHMILNVSYIMSIANNSSYPDIFLTLTTNSQLKKTTDEALPEKHVTNRLDLTIYLFQIKLRVMMA